MRHCTVSLSLIAVLLFFSPACQMEYFEYDRLSDEIELEPGILVPLIYGSMQMSELVDKIDSTGFVDEFDNGLIYLVYADTFLSGRADTLVEIQDKVVSKYYLDSDIAGPAWMSSSSGDTVSFYKKERFAFRLDGNDQVDSVSVKGGRIVLDVSSTFKHTGILTISSSQLLDASRDTFSTQVLISELDGSFSDRQVFLSDKYTVLTEEEDDSVFVQLNFKLDLINSGAVVQPDDHCEILASFEDMGFYGLYGYIDSRNLLETEADFDISLYEEFPELSSLKFADPRIMISTSSSVGIPVEVQLPRVVATPSSGEAPVNLEFTEGHPFVVPGLKIGQTGRADTVIRINNTTSNIDDFLNCEPSGISYEVVARTYSASDVAQHFILDSSRFDFSLEFLLPLDFKTTAYSLQDTLAFNMDSTLQTSTIRELEIMLHTHNELPLELGVQVYMLDDNYGLVDSIFNQEVILLQASSTDASGNLIEAGEELNRIELSTDRIDRLKETSYLRFVARLITAEEGSKFVKFYSRYSLDFELAMRGKFRINTLN